MTDYYDNLLRTTLNRVLNGAVVGAGAYGGYKLSKELIEALGGPVKPNNVITIDLPKDRLHKKANDILAQIRDLDALEAMRRALPGSQTVLERAGEQAGHGTLDLASKLLGYPTGVGLGMVGVAKLYGALKQKQLEQETKDAENNYLTTLNKLREKTAQVCNTPTPNVDLLITSVIKTASNNPFTYLLPNTAAKLENGANSVTDSFARGIDSATQSIKHNLIDPVVGAFRAAEAVGLKGKDALKAAVTYVSEHYEKLPNGAQILNTGGELARGAGNWVADTVSNSPVTHTLGLTSALTALLSGGLVYHALNRADRTEEANRKANNFPTQVDINPV